MFFVMRPLENRPLTTWWDEDVCPKIQNNNRDYASVVSRNLNGPSERDIREQKQKQRDEDKVKVFAQLVLALEMLAKHGITHNDLHWNNIMVEEVEGRFPVEVVDGDGNVCLGLPRIEVVRHPSRHWRGHSGGDGTENGQIQENVCSAGNLQPVYAFPT